MKAKRAAFVAKNCNLIEIVPPASCLHVFEASINGKQVKPGNLFIHLSITSFSPFFMTCKSYVNLVNYKTRWSILLLAFKFVRFVAWSWRLGCQWRRQRTQKNFPRSVRQFSERCETRGSVIPCPSSIPGWRDLQFWLPRSSRSWQSWPPSQIEMRREWQHLKSCGEDEHQWFASFHCFHCISQLPFIGTLSKKFYGIIWDFFSNGGPSPLLGSLIQKFWELRRPPPTHVGKNSQIIL